MVSTPDPLQALGFEGPEVIMTHFSLVIYTHSRTICNFLVSGNPIHKPKVLHAIRKGASALKASMPKIKDVNVIDKYSRIVFPVTFLLFNVGYWVFYFFE